uniref:Uncharacterized protein n=1 Tax=Phaeomonas parva TaxID=124430 RepID=A0A7S1U7X0_9STRA|mmetsp:Transcript_35912/g.112743  ORF Transcript_35912/g.112743 Transcript_35912/m.112743 type:complete len:138 (+) Transcript_35912:1200-1613(+)
MVQVVRMYEQLRNIERLEAFAPPYGGDGQDRSSQRLRALLSITSVQSDAHGDGAASAAAALVAHGGLRDVMMASSKSASSSGTNSPMAPARSSETPSRSRAKSFKMRVAPLPGITEENEAGHVPTAGSTVHVQSVGP